MDTEAMKEAARQQGVKEDFLRESHRLLEEAFALVQKSYKLASIVAQSDCDYWPLEQRIFRIWDQMDLTIEHWES